MYSLYGEHIRNGGRLTELGFFGSGAEEVGFAPPCRSEFFLYDRLIESYCATFGADRVLALPLEALRVDSDDFVARICTFAGVPVAKAPKARAANVGWGAITYALARRLNGLVRHRPDTAAGRAVRVAVQRNLWRLDKILPSSWSAKREQRVRDHIARRVDGVFGQSNRRTAEMTGFDLAGLGYDCLRAVDPAR